MTLSMPRCCFRSLALGSSSSTPRLVPSELSARFLLANVILLSLSAARLLHVINAFVCLSRQEDQSVAKNASAPKTAGAMFVNFRASNAHNVHVAPISIPRQHHQAHTDNQSQDHHNSQQGHI